jgi:hypothetical protein
VSLRHTYEPVRPDPRTSDAARFAVGAAVRFDFRDYGSADAVVAGYVNNAHGDECVAVRGPAVAALFARGRIDANAFLDTATMATMPEYLTPLPI